MAADPYTVLGVPRTASDEEVRTAYRRLVKATHPDHNGGSREAATRFEAVQEAYAEIQRLRRSSGGGARATGGGARPTGGGGARATGGGSASSRQSRTQYETPAPDPTVDARLADLERQVREAAKKAERAARKAAARATAAGDDARHRPTDEELGYVTTDDSFWKILTDARTELGERLEQARSEPVDHPVAKRVSDLIDGLEALSEKLDRKPKGR